MQSTDGTNTEVNRQILDFCNHLAGSCQTTALALSDSEGSRLNEKAAMMALLIIKDFPPRLRSYPRTVEGKNVILLAVDQWIFERDVDRGFLGEALASVLVFPYKACINPDYLHQHEVLLKKRLILEVLENMALSSPELSYRMHIQPEYFMYEVMLNRVRLFPPQAFGVSHFLSGNAPPEKVEHLMQGYREALEQLVKSGQIRIEKGFIIMSDKFIADSKSSRVRIVNISKNAPRALFSSVFGLVPQIVNFFTQNTEAFYKFQVFPWKRDLDSHRNFVNPQKYVFVPTSQGLVSLADRADIEAFASKVLSEGGYDRIKVEEFGGFLNDLYLIRAYAGAQEKKILVKRFKDWGSLKWFPLSIWSLGARSFAVLGRTRLEREQAISELLMQKGFNVPKILHVSASERLVFMEYIEAEDLSHAVKRIALAKDWQKVDKDFATITHVGELYARVHELGVVLGDTKPENVMVAPDGKIFLLDFEQASRGGDRSWDIAEFLYFAGHYIPLNEEAKAEAIARAFISGYLSGGGDVACVRRAGTQKYTRVFSIFTLPAMLRVMADVCKKAVKDENPKVP